MVRVQSGPPSTLPPNIPLPPPSAPSSQGTADTDLSSADDASFVILEQSFPKNEDECSSATELPKDFSLEAFVSGQFSLDLDNEYMQRAMRMMVQENIQLKSRIRENNDGLKRQIEVFTHWKHDVKKSKNDHRNKLTELNAIIDELKKDNQELKKDKEKSGKNNSKEKKNKEEKEAEPENVVPEVETDNRKEVAKQLELENSKRIADLTRKIEGLQATAKQTADDLAQNEAKREVLEKNVEALKVDNDHLKETNEALLEEKWQLATTNSELKKKLEEQGNKIAGDQQDKQLQDQINRLQGALAEESRVTEKLSRNLELEKRRCESLEQKMKTLNDQRTAFGGTYPKLPEETLRRDEQLLNSIEKYRIQSENLRSALHECEMKSVALEVQDQYLVGNLTKELAYVKSLLLEEQKRANFETTKLLESQSAFAMVFNDYLTTVESLRSSQDEKRGNAQEAESLGAKLQMSEELLREERVKVRVLEDKMRQMELDIEAIPILKAQVEVYQADFNAERAAREKIAGDKADLEEQLRKIQTQPNPNQNDALPIGLTNVRDRVNHMDEAQGARQSPPKALASPNRQAAPPVPVTDFQCPSCNAIFTQIEPLQAHVNRCLDRTTI